MSEFTKDKVAPTKETNATSEPCSTTAVAEDKEMTFLSQECAKLRQELQLVESKAREQKNNFAQELVKLEEERKRNISAQLSRRESNRLREDTEGIIRQHEEEVKCLSEANEQLRLEISEMKANIERMSAETDEENLKVATLLRKLRTNKKGMANIFSKEDDSFIEIIIPYSFF